MTIPHDEDIKFELLELLDNATDGTMHCNDVYDRLAAKFPELTRVELEEPYRNSKSKWANRVQFARQHCSDEGHIFKFANSRGRGYWTITEAGRQRVKSEQEARRSTTGSYFSEEFTATERHTPTAVIQKSPVSTLTEPEVSSRTTLEESITLIKEKEQKYKNSELFNPKTPKDGREHIIAAIVRRRGQPEFRRKLLKIYHSRCAITGSDAEAALEAAHILPYNGVGTNHSTNGLLLRADIHTLFDLGLLSIDPETMTVLIAPELKSSEYAQYDGKTLTLPQNQNNWPSKKALYIHRRKSGL
jgi:hypothetical protein